MAPKDTPPIADRADVAMQITKLLCELDPESQRRVLNAVFTILDIPLIWPRKKANGEQPG